ncbi:MAG: T9SS type A sorting domain-containing protein [Chitinophagaceae bacterium]
MKNLLTLVFVCMATFVFGNKATFQKLVEVNKCWTEQQDVLVSSVPLYDQKTEHDWIGIHLALVEQKLRERNIKALNGNQQAKRLHCLDILHRYWQEGNFPVNEDYNFRTPIFIDRHNNFCAVGFLMKETGNEAVCRKIAAQTNLAYVKEMKYPELVAWASENGFTIDELAWIQPGYLPTSNCAPIGRGVDGGVHELYVDEGREYLYIGGQFAEVDSSITANNIAYVTEASGTYTWHNLGTGVNGKVNAIAKFEDNIFVAGSFDSAGGNPAANVAYWDGSTWHNAGCLDGEVNDLLVFGGTLYASGSFKSCAAESGMNFASWNGTSWHTIPGLEGRINTMEVVADNIVLGGQFNYDTAANVNAIKWNPINSFKAFSNKVNNEVMDFEMYNDTLHAVCKRLIEKDTFNLFLKLKDDAWMSAFDAYFTKRSWLSSDDTLSFNTLCSEPKALNIGGRFINRPMLGSVSKNSMNYYGGYSTIVDSTVNKMILFKKELIMGGYFKTGMVSNGEGVVPYFKRVNGITKRIAYPVSITTFSKEPEAFTVYPNPAQSASLVKLGNTNAFTDYTLSQTDGKVIIRGQLNARTELRLPQVPAGIYFITLSNEGGDKVSKLLVE